VEQQERPIAAVVRGCEMVDEVEDFAPHIKRRVILNGTP